VPLTAIVLLLSAYAAGVVNAIAGGGTLLTFPVLVATGVPAVTANATSTVALVPGSLGAVWGLRREVGGSSRVLLALVVPSCIGGAIGAAAAHRLGDAGFAALAPWLVLGATALFLLQEPLRALRRTPGTDRPTVWVLLGLAAFQLPIALYGGFFGAGIGIVMLAALGWLGFTDIHRMNGLKNIAAACINAIASLTFLLAGRVDGETAAFMAVAALLGGYSGARFARWLGPVTVRRLVVVIGLSLTVYLFVR
jgi:hypothetical protein